MKISLLRATAAALVLLALDHRLRHGVDDQDVRNHAEAEEGDQQADVDADR